MQTRLEKTSFISMPASSIIVARSEHSVRQVAFHWDCVVLVRRGAKTLLEPLGSTSVTPGWLLAAGRGAVVDVINVPDGKGVYEALVLAFPLDLIQDAEGPSCVSRLSAGWSCIRPQRELMEAIERTHTALTDPASSQRLRWLRAAEVLELLALTGICFATQRLTTLEQVCRLLSTNPSHAWTLARVASECAVSASTLRRRLQSQGKTFTALLREIRLEQGLALLQTSTQAIGAISGNVGFCSASKFSAAFKARYGFSPSVLRNKSSATGQ